MAMLYKLQEVGDPYEPPETVHVSRNLEKLQAKAIELHGDKAYIYLASDEETGHASYMKLVDNTVEIYKVFPPSHHIDYSEDDFLIE